MSKKFETIMNFIKKYYFLLFAAGALLVPDIQLRDLVEEAIFSDAYVGVVVGLFTIFWISLILSVCVFALPKKAGRIVYIIITTAFIILSFSQYIYFKIFDQFFWIKSVMLVDEGVKYIGYAAEHIDAKLICSTLISLFFLVVAAIKWYKPEIENKKWLTLLLVPVIGLVSTHIYMQPELHNDSMGEWDSWRKPRVVYKRFNDVNKSFETTGLYQLTFHDIFRNIFGGEKLDENQLAIVDEYFTEKGELLENSYTGLFEGKNVIAVMLESIDTWMISEKYTPTLCKMMKSGINFTNYNAPFFGVGFTFSSEFAFNTGFFTPSSAVSASNFSTNSFPYSLANLFRQKGYSVNSFHFNSSEFYNRGIMHKSFGYEKYHALTDFGIPEPEVQLDSNMIKSDEFYNKMTEKQPFFDFIITYSAHLPYDKDDEKMTLAKEYRPDLIDESMNIEKNNALVLAADTDEFFRVLLERLEADGLLEDTVIVAYTDHFAYGISDPELVEKWKGNDIKYRVPAFIYSAGMKNTKVSKPMMTVDWLPTLANIFGLRRDGKYVGNDVLSPENPGFVYFETSAWMDDKMYYLPDEPEGYTPDEEVHIGKQNERVRNTMEVNDIIVLGNYFKGSNVY